MNLFKKKIITEKVSVYSFELVYLVRIRFHLLFHSKVYVRNDL
jgi:hypothetical protein